MKLYLISYNSKSNSETVNKLLYIKYNKSNPDYGNKGSIQTLFLGILKSLNIPIPNRPSETTSKMSHKLENMRSRDIRILGKFSVESFETLTRFCGNTVFRN